MNTRMKEYNYQLSHFRVLLKPSCRRLETFLLNKFDIFDVLPRMSVCRLTKMRYRLWQTTLSRRFFDRICRCFDGVGHFDVCRYLFCRYFYRFFGNDVDVFEVSSRVVRSGWNWVGIFCVTLAGWRTEINHFFKLKRGDECHHCTSLITRLLT